jgi:hypothetical protein
LSSSTVAYPALADHPVLTEALAADIDCVLNVAFRFWDPLVKKYRYLADGLVDLVRSDGVRQHGVTDAAGKLWEKINTSAANDPVIITKLNALAPGLNFWFEVVGNAITSGDLKTKYWSGTKKFPIAAWSTKGWTEPGGQPGTFRPTTSQFGSSTKAVEFTIGVAYCFKPKYYKNLAKETYFPAGLKISTLVNGVVKFSKITKFEELFNEVLFDVNPGDKIKFVMDRHIYGEPNICQMDVGVIVATDATGTQFELGKSFEKLIDANGIKTAEIYVGSQTLSSTQFDLKLAPSPFYSTGSPPTLLPKNDRIKQFNQAGDAGKMLATVNYFIGFTEQYRRFSNAMFKLAGGMQVTWKGVTGAWEGLPGLRLNIDYSRTKIIDCGRAKNSTTGRYEATINVGPADMARAALGDNYHELGHAVTYWYYFEDSDSTKGGSHTFCTMIDNRFAYIEGFAEFISSLFTPINEVGFFGWTRDWRKIFVSPAMRPFDVVDEHEAVVTNISEHDGFRIEGAFALGMYAVWVDVVRALPASATANCAFVGIADDDDGGEITGSVNSWLGAAQTKARMNQYVWAPISSAADGPGDVTTTEVVCKIFEAALSGGSWSLLQPTFHDLRLKFKFDIDTIGQAAVAQSTAFPGDWELVLGGPIQCSLNQPNTVLMRADYMVPTPTATLVNAGASTVAVTFIKIDEANLTIDPKTVGTFDLKIVSAGQTRLIRQAVKVVP